MFRFFCRSSEDVALVCVALGLVLVPLAASMLYEKFTAQNLLSVFGSREIPQLPAWQGARSGAFQALDSRGHGRGFVGAIHGRTMADESHYRGDRAGSVCLHRRNVELERADHEPRRRDRLRCACGPFACTHAVLVWGGVAAYCVLALVMTRPPYYLISRIDLTGGSTGWHRSRLIESSLRHLDEWWIAGTDHTRHWMATGVTWSADHTDLTNHYIALGVYGGLPLLLSFLAVLAVSFRHVGRELRSGRSGLAAWVPWTFGCALFAIAVTSVSISYFDQSVLWLYMTIALCNTAAGERVAELTSASVSVRDVVARHRAARRLRAEKPRARHDGIAVAQRP